MAQDPRLAEALARSREQSAAAVSSLRSMAAGIRREHEEFRRDRGRRSGERAAQARSGELGPEMQELQQRIDRGSTTWDDVLSGRDTHPSAVAARTNMARNLTDIGEQVREDPEVAEADEAAREAQARIERDLR